MQMTPRFGEKIINDNDNQTLQSDIKSLNDWTIKNKIKFTLLVNTKFSALLLNMYLGHCLFIDFLMHLEILTYIMYHPIKILVSLLRVI